MKLGKRRQLRLHTKKNPGVPYQEELKDEVAASLHACSEALAEMVDGLLYAMAQRAFLDRTLTVVTEGSDRSARSCSICYEEDLKLEHLGITPCAHVFCIPCLQQLVTRTGACGICRHPLAEGDARPIMLELPTSAEEAESQCRTSDDQENDHLTLYGTKLGKIASTLQQIKSDDETAKCIVFCQWEALLQKIAEAFDDFGIKHGRLKGGVHARTRTIAQFKRADSGMDVLLLSLEQSASGTNLTCASHVLFVHPMSAATQEQAVAFELQAIGRVRRWGQTRNEVHVWRFCTLGTVEEEITRQHQREVWERSAAFDEAASVAESSQNDVQVPLERSVGTASASSATATVPAAAAKTEVESEVSPEESAEAEAPVPLVLAKAAGSMPSERAAEPAAASSAAPDAAQSAIGSRGARAKHEKEGGEPSAAINKSTTQMQAGWRLRAGPKVTIDLSL